MENTNYNIEIDGIKYENDDNIMRGRTVSYHRKPAPRNLQKGAKSSDIAGLKAPQKRNLIDLGNGDYSSRFTIGFEVEKTRLHRGAVKQYPLFCGFETDSSCGFEAVTNILPLLPKSQWRTKVYSMMVEAKKVIEDSYSPSNTNCGGHITVAVEGMTGQELLDAMRKNCGPVLALFRKRLQNYYCKRNFMLENVNTEYVTWESHTRKYAVALVKGNCLEFRVPSRFQSVKQMMRRYELFYELVDFSINKPNGSHSALLKKLKPIINAMYEGDAEKVEMIMELSKAFRTMIIKRKINSKVVEWVDPRGCLERYYDEELTRYGC